MFVPKSAGGSSDVDDDEQLACDVDELSVEEMIDEELAEELSELLESALPAAE